MGNNQTEINLEDKSAIVTGGSIGIGSSIALKLAECGANVAIIDRDHKEEAEEVIKKIKALGRKGIVFFADVSIFNEARKIVDGVINEFGKIDILVNNAGINWDGVIWKMTEEQWDTSGKMYTQVQCTVDRRVVTSPVFSQSSEEEELFRSHYIM